MFFYSISTNQPYHTKTQLGGRIPSLNIISTCWPLFVVLLQLLSHVTMKHWQYNVKWQFFFSPILQLFGLFKLFNWLSLKFVMYNEKDTFSVPVLVSKIISCENMQRSKFNIVYIHKCHGILCKIAQMLFMQKLIRI